MQNKGIRRLRQRVITSSCVCPRFQSGTGEGAGIKPRSLKLRLASLCFFYASLTLLWPKKSMYFREGDEWIISVKNPAYYEMLVEMDNGVYTVSDPFW